MRTRVPPPIESHTRNFNWTFALHSVLAGSRFPWTLQCLPQAIASVKNVMCGSQARMENLGLRVKFSNICFTNVLVPDGMLNPCRIVCRRTKVSVWHIDNNKVSGIKSIWALLTLIQKTMILHQRWDILPTYQLPPSLSDLGNLRKSWKWGMKTIISWANISRNAHPHQTGLMNLSMRTLKSLWPINRRTTLSLATHHTWCNAVTSTITRNISTK